MTDEINGQFPWEPFVWRGALGGAIGNLLVVLFGVFYVGLRFGGSTLRDLIVIGGVSALLGGAIAGLSIGWLIWKATCKWEKQISVALRVILGFGCFLPYSLLMDLARDSPPPLWFTLGYAVLVGGVAGMMARANRSTVPRSFSASRA